jgi:hypothetical protein
VPIGRAAPANRFAAQGAFSPGALRSDKSLILSQTIALDEATPSCASVQMAPHQGGTTVRSFSFANAKRNHMTSKKPQLVRKPGKKIADPRRVRFGGGSTPRVLRTQDAETRDSRAIRFGGGSCPALLRK